MEISVSYAVIYMDAKSGKFLIVHPTHETYWSLPKGGMEEADGGDGANILYAFHKKEKVFCGKKKK